jgi:DNA-directed RNA polymerase specialized sigma24 family protein
VEEEFAEFVAEAEPSLRRALSGHIAPSLVSDALAEAMAYAWENWRDLSQLENPVGYLFRVAQSKARQPKQGLMPAPESGRIPEIEPGLPDALRALPDSQRTAVWLVHACGWSYGEVASAMGVSASTVGSHLERGLEKLRTSLGVESSA